MSEVKGSAIVARQRFVRERFGEEGYARLLLALDERTRARLSGRVLPHEWVPFEVFVSFIVEADRLFGAGDLRLCYEMGGYAAEVNLHSLYRLFYRLGSPMFFLHKAPRIWDAHYTSGKLTVAEEGPCKGRLDIEGFDEPHQALCQGLLGWAAKAVELSGGHLDQVGERLCRTRGDALCALVIEWT
jgi:hypothetical protein